jgi:hypothetical protein
MANDSRLHCFSLSLSLSLLPSLALALLSD